MAILGLAVWVWLKALPVDSLTASPNPAANYDEAVARVAVMQAQEKDDINPLCYTQLLTHDEKTEDVIIFMHGLTNCPAQFSELGELFYEMGYNVFIPRMPYHGQQNRMSTAQSQLTAEELVVYSDEVADIAQGLGDKTTVVGFSAGGVLASWLAQNRTDIDHVVLISPVLGLASVPAPLTEFATKTLLTLPNFYVWWNPVDKEDLPGIGNPRFSSHALAELLRLSEAVQQQAGENAPGVEDALVISNDFDVAVNQKEARNLTELWARYGVPVETRVIPLTEMLQHDYIDPLVPENDPDEINPMLLDLMSHQVE
jgi:pimeloyl-ACP methyl ester carboxylesterase